MLRRLIFSIAFAVLGTPAAAESDAPGAQFFDYGAFCAIETINQEVAEDTISGVLNLVEGTPVFYSKGPLVAAQIGIGFGIHLDVSPEFEGLATVVTTHPPMGPDKVTKQSWVTNYSAGETTYNGFTFEYNYELVQGDWSISATSNGRLIYEAHFKVLDPLIMPPPPCGTAPMS